MITDIIGKKFRRNKYGLSIWEDQIKEITYSLELIIKPDKKLRLTDIKGYMKQLKESHSKGFKVKPRVIGVNGLKSYDLDEIIIYL